MSRSARKGQKDIESAIHRLEQSLGRAPKESEIAEAMELELAEYQELLGLGARHAIDLSGRHGPKRR